MKLKKLFHWTVIAPILAWVIYFLIPDSDSTVILMLCGVFLMFIVFSAVHHSEVIAHKIS